VPCKKEGLANQKIVSPKESNWQPPAQDREISPIELYYTIVKETHAALFNRGKAEKLTPN